MTTPKQQYAFVATTLTLLLATTAPAKAAGNQKSLHHEAESVPVTHEKAPLAGASGPAKPLEIRAGGASVQFGGFVKFDAMQDLDPIGNSDQFKVNSIPVSSDPDSTLGGSSNMMARATRFTMDLRGIEGPGAGLRAYVEGDFFGSGNSFRIRHAYGEYKGFLAGQTWSTFQDISSRPFTLDYEGPDGEIFVRQAMVRYTNKVSDGLQWSVAAEDSDSQIASPVAGEGRSEVPDFTGNVRFTNDMGHVQVGGLLRQLRFVSSDGTVDEDTGGYGFNFSGSVNVLEGDSIKGQIAVGSGMGRYIESFGGTASDAYLGADGNLEALDSWAAVIGYTHPWNAQFESTFVVALAELDNVAGQAGDAISSSRSSHLNLTYKPFPQFMVGGEVMWGERENNDGSSGDAVRVQFSAQYNFR